jgi:predicted O-methyltransferase YrrM
MQFADPAVAQVFAEYAARHREEGERMRSLAPGELGQRRDEFLLPLGEDAAWFLHALALALKPRRILELGTSYGYSTLFFADAARQCGAKVTSVDLDAGKQAYARGMLEKAGLADQVEFRSGDAIAVVAADPGPFDLVLLDIWKDLYVAAFEAVYPKLSDEGVIASDNMIYPEGARGSARALRAAIMAKRDLQTALLPVGQGIELTVRWGAGNAKL